MKRKQARMKPLGHNGPNLNSSSYEDLVDTEIQKVIGIQLYISNSNKPEDEQSMPNIKNMNGESDKNKETNLDTQRSKLTVEGPIIALI